MAPIDVLKVAFPTGQEIPVHPPQHLFYMTENPEVYICMMKAIFEYQKACAEAEGVMYGTVLKCLSKEKT
jgi:hypothetical protein